MTRWEYNTATYTRVSIGTWIWEEEQLRGLQIFEALDALGRDGWELVSTSSVIEKGETYSTQFFFKRPL